MIMCQFLSVHQKTKYLHFYLVVYHTKKRNPFNFNKKSEDTDAVFFDSDNDGDDDLYVSSGVNLSPDTIVI